MTGLQDPDVETLLKEAREGNIDAFGGIYAWYAPRIFRFLYAQLNDRLDAEDLTEEVFLKTWQALPKYRERGAPFSAFLFRVASNTLTSHYRDKARSNGHLPLHDPEIIDTIPDTADNFSNRTEHRELRKGLSQLKREYQTVLVSRFISELSTEETARIMKKSPGAVRVLQHRALAALRKIMDKNENEIQYSRS
jgi:RNA polymerase sigma-70 factor, ECF subfamily